MESIILGILSLLYLATGIIVFVGYFPTIKDLYKHKKKSANLTSYIIWAFTATISTLYSIFILPDLFFIIVSGLNLFAVLIILILTIGLNK